MQPKPDLFVGSKSRGENTKALLDMFHSSGRLHCIDNDGAIAKATQWCLDHHIPFTLKHDKYGFTITRGV